MKIELDITEEQGYALYDFCLKHALDHMPPQALNAVLEFREGMKRAMGPSYKSHRDRHPLPDGSI